MDTNSYRTDPPADQEKARMLALDLLDPNKYVNEQQICYVARAFLELSTSSNGPNCLPSEIDRSKHGSVLMVWNDCMINHETLEMTWPKLVKAMNAAEAKHDATVDKEKLYRQWGKDDVR